VHAAGSPSGARLPVPRPPLTKRDGVLACLREGPATARELSDRGFPCPTVHIESLMFEDGISIEAQSELVPAKDGGCRSSALRFVLVRDDWADDDEQVGSTNDRPVWSPEFAGPNGSRTA
jgi:hypothetical protein